jgi:hypothetical protein
VNSEAALGRSWISDAGLSGDYERFERYEQPIAAERREGELAQASSGARSILPFASLKKDVAKDLPDSHQGLVLPLTLDQQASTTRCQDSRRKVGDLVAPKALTACGLRSWRF